MGLSVAEGTFQSNTVTGNQAVTGLGFQPKALILWSNGLGASGVSSTGTLRDSLGYGTSATQRGCSGTGIADSTASTGTCQQAWNESAILQLPDASGATNLLVADLVSLDADGFTINLTTAPGSAVTISYIAYGGSDITNAKVGFFGAATSNGNQATTDPGFQPDAVLLMSNGVTAAGISTPVVTSMNFARGAATSSTARFATHNSGIASASLCLYTLSNKTADFVSMDANGFTINWTAAPVTAHRVMYLAIKGGKWKVGSDSEATTNTTKATTGIGFQPAALSLFGISGQASALYSVSRGSATGTTARTTTTMVTQSAGTTRSASDYETNLIYKLINDSSGTVTTKGSADLSSFDADGFTLSWSSTDGTGRTFGYLAVAPAGATTPSGGTVTITGTAQVGQVLTATQSGWTNTPTSYQNVWQHADDAAFTTNVVSIQSGTLSGTTDTYTVAPADDTKYIRCQTVAVNGSGSSSAVNSAATAQVTYAAPVFTANPVISGTPVVGQPLTVTPGTTNPA